MTIATDIQRLYVAFFNRPADSAGLSYWVDQAAKNGGVEFVANAFSASPEYQPYLSTFSGMTNAEAVNAIYMNLFGRPAEASGVTYWTNALDNGLPLSKLALTISQGAQKGDAVAVANKVAAASAFTAATATSAGKVYGYGGDAANTVAKTWLSGVTDDASLAAKLGTVDATVAASGAAHLHADQVAVAQLYIGLFNRAPDHDGLAYWTGRLAAGASITDVANAMYSSSEATSAFASAQSANDVINKFYLNVLGRPVDPDGLAYWSAQMQTKPAGEVLSNILTAVNQSPLTDASTHNTQALLANKVATALYYSIDVAGNDLNAATQILEAITSLPASVMAAQVIFPTAAAAKAIADAQAAAAAADANNQASSVTAPPAGQTFTLTTGADTFTGGAGDDTFTGTLSYAGTSANASSTFNVAADTLDGGAGSDTLSLTASGASPNIDLSSASISNIEKLQVATTAATTTLKLTGTSFTELASSGTGTGGVIFNGFGTSVTKASVTGVAASSNATAGFTPDGGSLTGSTDAFTLTLTNNGSSTSTATINFKPMTGTTGFYETLNLVSAGTANFVSFSTTGQTSLAAVNISGSAPLTFGMTGSTEPLRTVPTFDASAATGNITLGGSAANAFLGAANQTVKLGAGNDTVFFGPNLDANDTVDGGAGRDTISVNTSSVSAAQLTNVTNFEVLRYEITSSGVSQDVSLLAGHGLTDIALSGSSSTTVQFTNMPASGITAVNVLSNMAAVTLAQSLADGSGASDALTLRFASTATSGATLLQVNDIAGLETLNIASGGSASSNTLTNNKVSAQQVLTGSVNFSTTASGSGQALKFDASAFTGKLTINGTSTGSGNDTVVLGSGNDVVNMRTGTDTITTGTQGSNAAAGFDLIAAVTGSAETVRFVSNTATGNGAATAYTNGAINAALIGSVTNTGTGNATGAVTNLTLGFSANDGDFSLANAAGTASTGLAKGSVAKGLAAGDTLVVQSVAATDGAAAASANLAVIKLTTAAAFSTDIKGTFAAAMGSASVTGLAADANYIVEMYDSTNSKTLFAVVNTGASGAGDTTLSAADFTDAGMAVIVGVTSTAIDSGMGLGTAF